MLYETSMVAGTATHAADQPSPQPLSPGRTSAPLGELGLPALEAHIASVQRFVAQRVNNFSDAQDLAQQTLLLASAKLETFQGNNLQAWLLTIARNLVIDHYRGQVQRRWVEMDEAVQMETEPALQSEPECVQNLCDSREKLRCWVNGISMRLRLEQQIALLLADVHGYRDKESAAELGISVACFKLLLHGARAQLREIAGDARDLARGREADAPPATGTHGQSLPPERPDQCPIQTATNSSPIRCPLGIKCCQQVPKLLGMRRELMKVFDLAAATGEQSLMDGRNRVD